MKKIVILFILVLFSANCVSAQVLNWNFLKKPSVQAPVDKGSAYDGTLSQSQQAMLAYNDNNIKAAFEILLAMKESDRSAQDWVLLGNMLQEQEKNSDAVFMYERATKLAPNYYKSYYNLGNIYLEEDKPYLAIENYRKANKLNNEFPYAYYNLGCAYLKTGDLRKAKIAFLKAIDIKNTEPDFHYNLAYTYKMLKKEKLSKQYLGFYNKLMEDRN